MKKQTHGFRSLFKKGVTTLLACSLLGSIISTGMLSASAATTEDIVVKHNSADYLVETTGSDRYGNGDWWCLNNSDYSIYKVTLNRYIEDFTIPTIGRYTTCQYFSLHLSKDGQNWLPFGIYDSNVRPSDSYSFTWDLFTTTHPENSKVVLENNSSKTIYVKLMVDSSKGGDFTFSQFTIRQTLKDDLDLRTGTQNFRTDPAPTTYNGSDHLKEADTLVSKSNVWDDTTVQTNGQTATVRTLRTEGSEVTYLVDFHDRTKSFSIGGWGECQNIRILVSRDGKEWYVATEQIGRKGIGSFNFPLGTDSLWNKAMDWVLAANPEKKVYFRFMVAEGGYIQYNNFAFKGVYNIGVDTEDPPATTDGLAAPTIFDGSTIAKGVSSTTTQEYRMDVYPTSGDQKDIDAFNSKMAASNVNGDYEALVSAVNDTVTLDGDTFVRQLGANGSLVYRVNMNDRTVSFILNGWGGGTDYTILLSKDNRTYYAVDENVTKGVNSIYYDSTNAKFKEIMDWVLSGNPDKTVYLKVITGANGSFKYVNLITKATINQGNEADQPLTVDPEKAPQHYDENNSATYTVAGNSGSATAEKSGLDFGAGNVSLLVEDVAD
ncbi:MAG: hypothetical protein IJD11_03585, partial [Oscillospiraceae bacterium]|nr:hypothetical protein [Oscillospiraceae bacterium]